MSKRKNYGAIIIIAIVVLGFFLLGGTIIWMQDRLNMMLGVFVFILFGVGQWISVAYWQNIQSDWEATGEVLARLQQAVSDIPAALETNLKAIAQKLSEGQQQALSKLQSEVSEGARQTLEKGAVMIGESISKNFQAPVGSLNTLLVSFTEKTGEQAVMIKALVDGARTDSREVVENGAALISQSLEKNLRAPLMSMESSLSSWKAHADVQAQITRNFGEEIRTAQIAWTEKAQSLASGLTGELKSLAATSAEASLLSQSAWADRATELQSAWESQILAMQESLVNAVARESGKLGSILAERAEALLSKVESLQTAQSESQSSILERALTGMESQIQLVSTASESFETGLKNIREASHSLIADLESKSLEGQNRLANEISQLQQQALGEAGKSLEAQSQIGLEIASKVSDLADQMTRGSKDFQDLSHLAQINQVEMQAGVGMLNSGLASILERLEKQAAAGDGYQNFLSELARALATFQERGSEVLIENAMKTQEILMEVLNQNERKPYTDRNGQDSVDALASTPIGSAS